MDLPGKQIKALEDYYRRRAKKKTILSGNVKTGWELGNGEAIGTRSLPYLFLYSSRSSTTYYY